MDGARLACRGGAALHVYRHADVDHLERRLAASRAPLKMVRWGGAPVHTGAALFPPWEGEDMGGGFFSSLITHLLIPPNRAPLQVITDGLFSMDGDFAPLAALVALKRRRPFLLAVDEAHATLVCGPTGGGAAEALGVSRDVDVHVGTLSKAVGAQGGFVAGSAALCALLTSRGRPGVFSTALAAPVVAAASAALRLAGGRSAEPEPGGAEVSFDFRGTRGGGTEGASLRAAMWARVDQLGAALGTALQSPIVPIVLGTPQATLEASARLLRAGLHVGAIRPPTVPEGSSRLRVTLSAAHSEANVTRLAAALRAAGVLPVGGARGPASKL